MKNIPSLVDMLKAGVHFGHRTSRWHPKMKPFIFGVRSGIHVIDVEKTTEKLEEAIDYVQGIVSRGGKIVFIGTKNQISDVIEKYAREADMPYVTNRWLGGTFTNFEEIRKLIRNFLDLKDKREKGELKKYTKLEQLQFDRKIEDLEEKIGGISSLTRLPDAILVFDARNEKTAILEAKKQGVKVISLCDTNVNPAKMDYIIPANDDSIASITMMARLFAESIRNAPKSAPAAKTVVKEKKEDVNVAAKAKAEVDDIDDEVKDKLAQEKREQMKK